MKSSRRGPNLFEVMNKAPQSQPLKRRFGLFGRRSAPARQVMYVAEPLTEAQAAEELARGRAAEEAERRRLEEKRLHEEERRREREAARAAKIAARQARREAREDARRAASAGGADSGRRGFTFPFSPGASVALAGGIAALALAAFALGLRSGRTGAKFDVVAATTEPRSAAGRAASDAPATESKKPAGSVVIPPDRSRDRTAQGDEAAMDPDLKRLMQPPALGDPAVGVNQPTRVGGPSAADAAARPENLNYLQVESFLVTRERTGEQLARDVADVRAFLLKNGVRTFARKRSNGYVLFAEEGVPPGKDYRRQRENLARRIEQLGSAYRESGGRYQFKGCFFVSYAATRAGDPVP